MSPDTSTRPAGRGRLKVFLGYAAGVGKTFRMLEEARMFGSQLTARAKRYETWKGSADSARPPL